MNKYFCTGEHAKEEPCAGKCPCADFWGHECCPCCRPVILCLNGTTESCDCACSSVGELIVNGDMERFDEAVPIGWGAEDASLVSKTSQQGRVHSGDAAVHLKDGAELYQEVAVHAGCHYALSFFAKGEGAQVGVTADVVFLDEEEQPTQGLRILVRKQDLENENRAFGYYRAITTAAPVGTQWARIVFRVSANGEQGMDLDDVSFSVS